MAKILVVDDEPSTRILLKAFLSEEYQVILAKDGIECISILNQDPSISLVLIDVNMPVLGGMDAIKYIKSQCPGYKKKPIIVMSSQSTEENIHEAKKLKANGWLNKPLQKNEVLTFVNQLLKK